MAHTEIREAALTMTRVDTHGHLASPVQDLKTAAIKPGDVDSRVCAASARIYAAGCEALYGVRVGPVLTTDAPPEVFERAAELRGKGRQAAFARAFEAAGIETQFCFCNFQCSDAADKRSIAPHVRLLAYLDGGLALLGEPKQKEPYVTALERVHGRLEHIGDLLQIVDRQIDSWRSHGVVGMKTSLAYYDHGLALRNTSEAEAKQAFARREDMSDEDARLVRDFAARHAFDACLRNGLPVVFHTGMTGWGTANLTGTNPALLQPVLMDRRWRELTFVILHGGYPYTGETAFLAARIPNVVIDFTWLSWGLPTRFRSALAEWIEYAPMAQFVWGSDSGPMPEGIVGIDVITRHLIADVLEKMVAEGQLDAGRALRFVELSYRENARRIFHLDGG